MNIIPATWVSEIRSIQGVSLLYCIYTELVLRSGADMISQSNRGVCGVPYRIVPVHVLSQKPSEILAFPDA